MYTNGLWLVFSIQETFIRNKNNSKSLQEEIADSSESLYVGLRTSMTNDSFKLVANEEEILALVNEGNAIAVEQDDIRLSFSVRNWCELVHMPVSFVLFF
jgi:hypothetical protein